VHHLFPKIPFYKAEKATRAIVPLLDSHYWVERNENFLQSLWKTFRQCRWVSEAAVEGAHVASGVMLWDMSGAKQHQL
jgi:fatty acid desaturase